MYLIKSIKDKVGNIIYPKTRTDAIFDSDGNRLDNYLDEFIIYREYSVTASANSASKLGYYGTLNYSVEGYRPISFSVVGGSGNRGYVTYNYSGGAYLWAESAGTYTVRVFYVKV